MPRTRSLAWSELKLGVVGIVAIALVMLLVLSVGGKGGFFWQRYPLKTRFSDIQGMKPGAVVRVSGKEVGKVTSVEFAGAEIEVVMEVSKQMRPLITDRSVARIGTLSLLGESIVELQPAPGSQPLPDWAYVPSAEAKGAVAAMTESAVKNLDEAGQLIADLRAGKGTMGQLLTNEDVYNQLRQLTTASSAVVRGLQQGRGTLGLLVNDDAAYRSLKASVDNLQTVTERINSGQGPLGRLVHDDEMGRNLSQAASNFEQMSDRLNKGQGTAGKFLTDDQIYNRFNTVADKLDKITTDLGAGKGTAGKLLNDNQMYDTLNHAATELAGLLADIRKDPKKYLNVRVSIF